MATPTLINLPPPPSDPVTPSEMGPGTPNSGTTSLSTLSTVAIKDGHQGHSIPHSHHRHSSRDSNSSATTLDAERADRISRLAGLERVATVRASSQVHSVPSTGPSNPPPGYFDNVTPHIRERSTVGSASATGSVGGRTTWASGSVDYDADKMSEDQDDGISSTGGFSDEGNASLVGFGETAGSTVSGPISTATAKALAARQNPMGSPTAHKSSVLQHVPHQAGNAMGGPAATWAAGSTDPRMMDGMSYDANVIDTTTQPAPPIGQQPPVRPYGGVGADMAERIMRDRITDNDGGRRPMGSPDERGQGLGKFSFERE